MHTSIERRTPSATRMPVTMSVELVHDGWEETYEADAVNVSSTGIGVRGPMLPDVGQRMRCRFSLAELDPALAALDQDGACETEGEVVWASDAGDAGEFGIRFDMLEPKVSEALARWVSSLENGSSLISTASHSTASHSTPIRAPGRQHVRVQLDGVASPIEAEVSMTEGRRVRVEQALPFLLLGTRATVNTGSAGGVRRVLRSVELKIEGSVPKLVLELETSDDSIASDVEGAEGPSTMADEPLDAILARSKAPIDDVVESAEPSQSEVAPVRAPKPRSEKSKKRREDDSPRAVRLEERDALAELGVEVPDAEAEEPAVPFLDRLRETGDRVRGASQGLMPSLVRLTSAMRTGWAAAVAATGPRLVAFRAWLGRVIEAARAQLGTRLPQLAARFRKEPAKRRTTSAPQAELDMRPTRSTGGKRAEAAPEIAVVARPKLPLRMILAGGLVAVALMFVVRALSAPAVEEVVVPAPTLELAEETAPIEAAPVAEPVVAAPVVAEAAPAPVEPAPLPVLPGTLAASSTEAGRLAAPTFPRVEEGAAETATAEAEVEETLPAPTGRTTFGAAEVPHGRATTLTMTLPITSLEGEATDSGFTVNLPGVNSLSRAAPIAAANPSVERAAILNSGDHAVLTVRFVAGRTPAYRVEARGSDLIVTIGR